MKRTGKITKQLMHYVRNHVLAVEITVTLLVLGGGAWFFHIFEGVSLYDSFYYTIITVAGVGYGDIAPITSQGKMIAIMLASLGLPLYLVTATIIASKVIEGMKRIKKTAPAKTILSKVKALIIEDKKILFLKINRGEYTIRDLPGGTIRYGERAETALARRVANEIHCQIKIKHSIGIRWRIDTDKGIFSLCHTFLAHLHHADKKILQKTSLEEENNEYEKTEIVRISTHDIINKYIDIDNESLYELIQKNI